MTDQTKPLTAIEAAEYLGVSLGALRQMTRRRQIPYYKPFKRKVFYKVSDLAAFIEGGRVSADYELDELATRQAFKGGR